jgi:hypothetical protein
LVEVPLSANVEVSKSKPSGNNNAAGNYAQILKGDHVTEKAIDSEDSIQTIRTDGVTKTRSQKLPTSKTSSNVNASGWQQREVSRWEDCLSELAAYSKINGHCNVPQNYSENPKLGEWVKNQRKYYMLHLKGKASPMTTFRIQELESLGFEWRRIYFPVWEDRLTELADYRKIYGHCNVPSRYSKNTKLGVSVATQRNQYMLHLKGETSFVTLPRIQALESLGFEWKLSIGRGKRTRNKPNLDDDARRVHKKLANARQGADSQLETAPFNAILRTTGYH